MHHLSAHLSEEKKLVKKQLLWHVCSGTLLEARNYIFKRKIWAQKSQMRSKSFVTLQKHILGLLSNSGFVQRNIVAAGVAAQ